MIEARGDETDEEAEHRLGISNEIRKTQTKRFEITTEAAEDIMDRLDYLADTQRSPYTRSAIRTIKQSLKSSLFFEKEDAVDQNHSEEDRTLLSEILFAIGQASMCWEYPERAGVFDDQEAVRISHRLYETILEEYI